MAKRRKLSRSVGAYALQPDDEVEFFPSGCQLLDLALGGGWAQRRVINIVGDKSTGKTLLCIEAAANFARVHPEGRIRYRETESAFSKGYAGTLGMPLDRVDFGEPVDTVEDIYEELNYRAHHAEHPELFIVDSLDALSTRTEQKRVIGKASYGADKAKAMSELFRCCNSAVAAANITTMIVSQERDKIGAMFGKKTTRSGGRALDFYASQVVWLAQIGRIKKTVAKQERTIGIRVRANLDKNKVGTPYLQADFPILFSYGIEDERASREWLAKAGIKKPTGDLHEFVEREWTRIEASFRPKKAKYS